MTATAKASHHESFNFYKIVKPLLSALGFQGEGRVLLDAVPHLLKSLNLHDLQEFMAHLGYASDTRKLHLARIPMSPGIFTTKKGSFLVTCPDEHTISLKNLHTLEEETVERANTLLFGSFCFFFTNAEAVVASKKWIIKILNRFKGQGLHLLFIGLFNALFGLTLPFFVRSVFDWAIPSKSFETLHFLLLGLVIALACHHMIHAYQTKCLAYIGGRLMMIINTSVITKILKLPFAYVEGASVSEQMTRIKQFEGVKDVFTSPIAQLILEGPFLILFLVVLGIMGGPLVLVPIVLIACFVILAGIIFPLLRSGTRLHSFTYNQKLSFMLEVFSRISTVKYLGRERVFNQRFEEKLYGTSKSAEHNEILSAYATNISQILIKIAGVVTIMWGALRVMNGDMTTGSLVAVVLLIWRALSPLQSAFMFFSQFDLTLSTIGQINQLMTLPSENYAKAHIQPPVLKGYILCENLAFRYPGASNFALQGVSMEAQPGEILAIMGDNASGKSTLLKILLGFYKPLSGSVTLDHLDARHISVNHLRQNIAFVPQHTQFFHGTIEQNFLLSNPSATLDDIKQACEQALVWEDVCALPSGLHTKLSDRDNTVLNSGFQQKLALARAYVRHSSILLMDEPGSNLDFQGDEWLKKTILSWRGKKTVIIVTHRPSIINLSNRLLVLSEGKMKYFGPTNQVLEIMKQGQKS